MDTLFYSRETNPDIPSKISIPSAFTNSTDSSYGIASSQHSFDITSSESDFFNLSEFEHPYSANGEPQAFIPKAEFVDPMRFIPPLNPVEAHGTMDLKPNLFADSYSTAMQPLEPITCVDPAALSGSFHLISDSKAQMASVEKPFICPHCPFCKSEPMCIVISSLFWLASAREHALRMHIGTHDKEACPAYDYNTAMQQLDSVTSVGPTAVSVHEISG